MNPGNHVRGRAEMKTRFTGLAAENRQLPIRALAVSERFPRTGEIERVGADASGFTTKEVFPRHLKKVARGAIGVHALARIVDEQHRIRGPVERGSMKSFRAGCGIHHCSELQDEPPDFLAVETPTSDG